MLSGSRFYVLFPEKKYFLQYMQLFVRHQADIWAKDCKSLVSRHTVQSWENILQQAAEKDFLQDLPERKSVPEESA